MAPVRNAIAALALVVGLGLVPGPASARPAKAPAAAMPRYQHIFVIVAENKGYHLIMDHPDWTPVIHRLASQYGEATDFFAEVHSSEANYIAMLGGDTFGIHDDDAYYCTQGMKDRYCENANEPDYANHDITAPSLMDQLAARGMTWKAYMEDIPAAGSLAPRSPTPDYPTPGAPSELYAAKHNGFASVSRAPLPQLERQLVSFHQLDDDLAADTLSNYAHIIPNQCNDMHGRSSDEPTVPADCGDAKEAALIKRGDAEIGALVDKITHAKIWRGPGNVAIVVTFDENDKAARASGAQGCCGYEPNSKANFGGGHIPTIVITNHGPRHVQDATPYNHYSLLRTTEAAFGINDYLGHAADTDKGVATMTPLFAVFP